MRSITLALRALALPLLLVIAAFAHADEALIRFRLEVDAPASLKATLQSSLELARWQSYDRMTPELLAELVKEARGEALAAAEAEGYFSPRVEIAVEGEGDDRVVRLAVEPGEPTRVRQVSISVRGDPDPSAAARVRELWALPAGEIFRQGAWEAAKKRAAETLATTRYADARVVASRAEVDPETRAADLEVELASGPPFAFGEMAITGLKKYGEEVVRALAPFNAGDPYSRDLVELFVRRLNATNYFASVQVNVDTDPSRAATAPVRVSVIEAPTRRLEIGVGYSTDTQYRASVIWRDVNLFDSGWRLRGNATLESKIQGVGASIDLPAASNGWADSLIAGAARTDIQNLVTRTVLVGATRSGINERNQPAFGASYYLEDQAPSGAPTETAHALFARYDHVWRTVDELVQPRNGALMRLLFGAGVPGVSTRAFGRVVGQLQWFQALTRRDEIVLRSELGAVLASSSQGIPQALLFRTGGDTTVRGYAFESLGVKRGDAVVGGRYYALASAEYIHWIGELWGLAVFVDAGDAADSVSGLKLAVGYGTGVRVKSPIGPFRLDLAYGQETHQFRIHFSVGLAF